MNPIEAVFWWGVVAGACAAVVGIMLLVIARALVFKPEPVVPDFTGEHHDGRP